MQRPFASRTNVFRSQRDHPASSNRVHTPPYSPISDPHLEHFFRRKLASERQSLSSSSSRGRRTPSLFRTQPIATRDGLGKSFTQHTAGKTKQHKKIEESTYKVTVKTGDFEEAGTSAQVFITIRGSRCKWAKKRLASKSGEVFSPGSVRSFRFSGPDLGEITSVTVEHNSVKRSDGWYLQHVLLINTDTGDKWKCSSQQWLSLHHSDCQTSRTLPARQIASDGQTAESSASVAPPSYNETLTVTVVTGDTRGAGTDANVYLTLHGTKGSTDPVHLKGSGGFERSSSTTFAVTVLQDLGVLTGLHIEHDNTGFSPAWFLDHVVIQRRENLPSCRSQNSTASVDNKPPPLSMEEIATPILSAVPSGSSARVDSRVHLPFTTRTIVSVSPPPPLTATTTATSTLPSTFFLCDMWLAVDAGDRLLGRHLEPTLDRPTSSQGFKYTIVVETGDVRGAGTDASVFISLYGQVASLEKKCLDSHPENFERGRQDRFTIKSPVDLGQIESVHVSHDNTGPSPGWYVERVTVANQQGREWVCSGRVWLGKGFPSGCSTTLHPDIAPERNSSQSGGGKEAPNRDHRSYAVEISTGDDVRSGTTADVFVVLHSGKCSSNVQWLEECREDAFSSGSVDSFRVFVPRHVHPIERITLGHNCRGKSPAWFVQQVRVVCTQHDVPHHFHCGEWIVAPHGSHGSSGSSSSSSTASSGRAERTLVAQAQPSRRKRQKYIVSLRTGDHREAGTNALIHVELSGSEGASGRTFLPDEEEFFERGLTDTFEFTWPVLGEVEKVVIGHDGTGEYPDWLLDQISVSCCSSGQVWTFECKQWLRAGQDTTLHCTRTSAPTAPHPLGLKKNGNRCPSSDDDDDNGEEDFEQDHQKEDYEDDFSSNGSSSETSSEGEEDEEEDKEEEEEEVEEEEELQFQENIPYTIHLLVDGSVPGKHSLEVRLVGSEAESPGVELSYSNGGSSSSLKQQQETFSVDTVDIGALQGVKVANNSSLSCHLLRMVVTSPTKQWSCVLPCPQPLRPLSTATLSPSREEGLNDSQSSASTSHTERTQQAYELRVFTSDKKQASTNNSLKIQLAGSMGTSRLLTVRNRPSKALLQRGQIDSLQVASPPLGSLQGLKITHSPANKGKETLAPDLKWHLYKVIVRDVLTGTSYSFPCKSWVLSGVFVDLKPSEVEHY